MYVKSVLLNNFRLHSSTELTFSDKLNYILGGNGQGKTTILEAIYYLCTTKSLNQSPDNEAVNFEEEKFLLKGFFKDLVDNKVTLEYDANANKKSFFVDEKQVYRASQMIGKFPVVTLTQSDHAITLGPPAERRKFVDSVISQSSENYLKTLLDYNKTLRHRSSLLTQIRETRDGNLFAQLDAWTESLIKLGSELIKYRIKFIDGFDSYIKESYQKVMQEKEIPEIEYEFAEGCTKENVYELFGREIERRRDDELRRATNLVGPHRDDFMFKINGYELRKYGSQGQHKTFQIATRFGQFFYLKDKIGKTPIFLLDDVFGELDTYRANMISKYLKEIGQAFITMTDFANVEGLELSDNDTVIKVHKGTAEYA